MIENKATWNVYGPLLESLFPDLRLELIAMATKRKTRDLTWDLVLETELKDASPKQLIEENRLRPFINKIGMDGLLELLTPEQQRELVARIGANKK